MKFTIPLEELSFRASRSGGPGGQHVNTSATRVEARWNIAESQSLSDEQRQRLVVKPGLTGPMQVSGRGALDMDQRLALELDYIQNYSLGRDMKILLKTISAVFKTEGAF